MSQTPRPLLSAAPEQPGEADALRRRVDYLQAELTAAHQEIDRLREQCRKAIGVLDSTRNLFAPFHNTMRRLFGEIDEVCGDRAVEGAEVPARVSSVWESWKRKLGGKQADFIQAMLEHGEVSVVQLKVMAHCGTTTVHDTIYKLNKLGLINKNAGKYSLKPL